VGIERAAGLAADRDPVKATVGGDTVADALGGEHHLVVVSEPALGLIGVALLIPDDPRNGVLDAVGVAGETDGWCSRSPAR
jgi:hypothetical protein